MQRTLVIIVALLFFSPITNLGFTNNIKTKSELNHKWTWLFYDDVDYEPAIDPFDEFAEEISSNNNFDIIVLQDTLNDTGKIWEIGNEHEKKLMQTLDEIDMGDFNTLKNFINFGKEQYPADRYILTIFDHGAGWAGACLDETNDGWLTMDEMQRALLDSGGVDILCFIACQMASVESAYELRHCTDIYIGSQETTGYSFWKNTSSKICRIINENPEISNEDLGMMIIDSIKQENDENNYPGWLRYINKLIVTMSAIKTEQLDTLVKKIDQLSIDLIEKLETNIISFLKIKFILSRTPSYGDLAITTGGPIIALYTFAKKCSFLFHLDKNIRSDAKDIMDFIEKVVIKNHRGIGRLRSHGLSIYFPEKYYNNNYQTSSLDFTVDTNWNNLIITYQLGYDKLN